MLDTQGTQHQHTQLVQQVTRVPVKHLLRSFLQAQAQGQEQLVLAAVMLETLAMLDMQDTVPAESLALSTVTQLPKSLKEVSQQEVNKKSKDLLKLGDSVLSPHSYCRYNYP